MLVLRLVVWTWRVLVVRLRGESSGKTEVRRWSLWMESDVICQGIPWELQKERGL